MVLREKIEVSTRTKKFNFPKGLVHGFCPKIELSLIAFFSQKLCHKRSFSIFLRKKNQLLSDQKIEVLSRAKNFLKGVSPWILSKNQTLSYLRFSQKSYQKRSFLILWKEKNDFK